MTSNLARVHFTVCCGEGPSCSLVHWSLYHWCGLRGPYFLTAYNALCPPPFWRSDWSRTGHREPLPAAAPSLCPIIFTALGYFLAKRNIQHLFKLWVKPRQREEKRKEEKESRLSGEETDERECSGRLGSTGPSERGGPAPSLPQRAEPGPRETKRTLSYAFGGNKVCILLMILLGADDRNPTQNRRRERKSENLLAYKPENNGVSTQLCSVASHAGSGCWGGCWRQFLPVCLVSLLLSVAFVPGQPLLPGWQKCPQPSLINPAHSAPLPLRLMAALGVSRWQAPEPGPALGGAVLSWPMRATCSPWGQRAGRGPEHVAGRRPKDLGQTFTDREERGVGKGDTESPCGEQGALGPPLWLQDKPQPRLLAVPTRSRVWTRPLTRNTTWSSHLKTEAPVRPACSWQPVPTSRPSAARRASGPGAQRKGTARQAAGSSPHPDRPRLITPPRAPRGSPSRQGVISRQMTAQSART